MPKARQGQRKRLNTQALEASEAFTNQHVHHVCVTIIDVTVAFSSSTFIKRSQGLRQQMA